MQHTGEGLAEIDAGGVFVAGNAAAAALCGLDPDDLPGRRSPFRPGAGDGGGDRTAEWEPAAGTVREFSYVLDPVPGTDRWVVAFRDVTESRLHQRRLAAIAKAASRVASERSLTSTLETLAQEVLQADALAGVQILTVNSVGDRLHVMGAAGFGRTSGFFEKLQECHARGARLVTLEALAGGGPVVLPHRYDEVMHDPAWEPMQDFLRHPRWDAFASVPLVARGQLVGVLNAFFAPGRTVGDTDLSFLVAMAEQAAMAVDQASRLERESEVARREERQRLARDLHDSVVQQVFSIMMQAKSLGVLVGRGLPPPPEQVARVAEELSGVAEDVLADLRGMVVELRPVTPAGPGLVPALQSLADTTAARSGLRVTLAVRDPSDELAGLDPDLVEDVYRVVAEAVHNSVKHASASRVAVRLALADSSRRRRLTAEVVDDGIGLGDGSRTAAGAAGSSGFGMTAMRERAARWGGVVRVRDVGGGGTRLRLTLPLPRTVPTGAGAHWAATS
nr:GAF domain-containing sensor histidine kinase [Geodermatophilus sabuli]